MNFAFPQPTPGSFILIDNAPTEANDPASTPSAPAPEDKWSVRVVSLDAFRGLTIVLMLLVNNIALDADTPPQLLHAPWNQGVRLADLVFPWFLLCVGIAIPFSIRSARKNGITGWRFAFKVLSRTIALFVLGLLVDSSILRQPTFGLGVLQLIALAYLGGSLLAQLPMIWRAIASGALLLAYGLILRYTPIPGVGVPMFEENSHIVRYVNDAYLAPFGLRGLPSMIPTAALVALGSMLGSLIGSASENPSRKLLWATLAGTICALVGILWNESLPFNKPVWTPAYILLSAGLGAILLSVLFVLFDLGNRKKLAFPLVVFGSNALLAYVGPVLIKTLILQVWTIGSGAEKRTLQDAWMGSLKTAYGPINGGLAYTFSYIAIVWIVLFFFYRKGLFLRV